MSPRPDPAPRGRDRWAALAATAGLAAAVLGRARSWQRHSKLAAQTATFSHYGIGCWAAATLLSLRRPRSPVLAALSGAGLLWQLSWFTRYFRGDQRRATSASAARLTVVSLNVEYGRADPEAVLALAADADLVVLIEVTPLMLQSLAGLGFDELFPHRVGAGEPNSKGTTIHSRFALEAVVDVPTRFQSKLVRVSHHFGDVLLAGVHPISPMGTVEAWNRDAELLRAALAPRMTENLIVIGDFNAADQHHTMHALAQLGLTDAAQLLGRGPHLTWPTRGLPIRLVAIDHALVGPTLAPKSLRTVRVPGTDHAALVLVVEIPEAEIPDNGIPENGEPESMVLERDEPAAHPGDTTHPSDSAHPGHTKV